jgi:hypothetical protein
MRWVLVKRSMLALAIAVLGGCLEETSYQCTGRDMDCGRDGVCESVGYCSFPDPSCSLGRRFGALGAAYANQCTTSGPIDAGTHHDGHQQHDGTTAATSP